MSDGAGTRNRVIGSERNLGALEAAVAAALFGSAYVATAFQLRGFTPLGGALWRGSLAVGLLLVVLALGRMGRQDPPSEATPPALVARLARLAVLGILGGLLFIAGMNLAVSWVGATVTSFVAGLYAVLAALFAPVVLQERLERRAVLGFAIALAGTILLAELGPSRDAGRGLLAGVSAAISYGLYLVLIRRWSAAIQVGPVGVSLATALTSAVGLGIGLAAFDPGQMVPFSVSPDVIVSTGWLAFVTAFGPLLATAALRRIEASFASSLLLLNPVTATVLSVLLLGERLSVAQVIGGLLVLVGMAAATDLPGTVRRQRQRAAAGQRAA